MSESTDFREIPRLRVDIAYVTYQETEFPDDDQDLPLVLAACDRAGLSAEPVIWDDPKIDWTRYRCAVVRSTWDYVEKYAAFRGWLRRVNEQTVLLNPLALIEANLDKVYLRDLDVPIVPTWWINSTADVPLVDDVPGEWLVIKPTVSAGARDTFRTNDRAMARTHVRAILNSGRQVMAQPYLDGVDRSGEISVICIDGQPMWAAKKIPALTQGGHGGSKEAVPLTDELAHAALRSLRHVPGSLYARVDLVEHAGDLVLMELELTEPSLFLPLAPAGAADVLVRAIAERLEI